MKIILMYSNREMPRFKEKQSRYCANYAKFLFESLFTVNQNILRDMLTFLKVREFQIVRKRFLQVI